MSSIGRPSATIDLNTTTITVVSSLNEQVEQAEIDIDALEVRATILETETTSLAGRATILEGNVATNTESINTINTTIGDDTIDPKTGIFLELQKSRAKKPRKREL